MTIFPPAAALWLLQATAGAHDTLLVRPLPPIRTAFEQVAFVAGGITSILTLVLVIVLLVALVWLRKSLINIAQKLELLSHELRPLLQEATATSQSVKLTADLIRHDVTTMHDAISVTSERVKNTVGELADRVDDFNDLLGKVHHTADTVVDIAGTTIKGLAWGAQTLRERRRKRKARKAAEQLDAAADDTDLDDEAKAPALAERKRRRVRRAATEPSDLDD